MPADEHMKDHISKLLREQIKATLFIVESDKLAFKIKARIIVRSWLVKSLVVSCPRKFFRDGFHLNHKHRTRDLHPTLMEVGPNG